MKLDLYMSDPLTLGLNLGMGHPVTERIRRLTMRKTNKVMRGGTAMIIVAGLALSSSIVSSAAVEPVEEVVNMVLKKADIKAEIAPDATFKPKVPLKLAEATQAQTLQISNPMRLRLTPRFTKDQLSKIEEQRQAVAKGEGDKNAKKALDGTFARLNFLNRFQVTIAENGQGLVEISKGQGGWPGYPVTNTGWAQRPLSSYMQHGLKSIVEKCSFASSPVYFLADLIDGDGDVGKGTFEVECVPGSNVIRAQVTDLDLAYAYLASDDLPLERRQGNFQWKFAFASFQSYVKNHPNTTIARDREECVKIYTTLKRDYGFTERHQKSADHQLSSCATNDYNWVRRRENIPEVQ